MSKESINYAPFLCHEVDKLGLEVAFEQAGIKEIPWRKSEFKQWLKDTGRLKSDESVKDTVSRLNSINNHVLGEFTKEYMEGEFTVYSFFFIMLKYAFDNKKYANVSFYLSKVTGLINAFKSFAYVYDFSDECVRNWKNTFRLYSEFIHECVGREVAEHIVSVNSAINISTEDMQEVLKDAKIIDGNVCRFEYGELPEVFAGLSVSDMARRHRKKHKLKNIVFLFEVDEKLETEVMTKLVEGVQQPISPERIIWGTNLINSEKKNEVVIYVVATYERL